MLNVGAGAGSYEPAGLELVALEPSGTMLAQRRADAAPAVQGVAERLPFGDGAFEAVLAILTLHHWVDPEAGLAELARVAPLQVVVTFDPEVSAAFWLHRDYLPALADLEASQASLATVRDHLSVRSVTELPVPRECADGFLGAFWARPERYLDASVRAGSSGLSLLDQGDVDDAMRALASDLEDGTWRARNAGLDDLDALDVGFRLVVAQGPQNAARTRDTLESR